jgi:hypothetical protein
MKWHRIGATKLSKRLRPCQVTRRVEVPFLTVQTPATNPFPNSLQNGLCSLPSTLSLAAMPGGATKQLCYGGYNLCAELRDSSIDSYIVS